MDGAAEVYALSRACEMLVPAFLALLIKAHRAGVRLGAAAAPAPLLVVAETKARPLVAAVLALLRHHRRLLLFKSTHPWP